MRHTRHRISYSFREKSCFLYLGTPYILKKIFFFQMNFQLKGFYSEQDQDMRISTNGDVDMRSLPPVQAKAEPAKVPLIPEAATKMDVDIRNHTNIIMPSDITNIYKTEATENKDDKTESADNSLTIDEKHGN